MEVSQVTMPPPSANSSAPPPCSSLSASHLMEGRDGRPAKRENGEYFPLADLRRQVGRARVRKTLSRFPAKINTLGVVLMESSEREGRKEGRKEGGTEGNVQSLVAGEQATGAVAANRNSISISLHLGTSITALGLHEPSFPSRVRRVVGAHRRSRFRNRRQPTYHHQIAVLVSPFT